MPIPDSPQFEVHDAEVLARTRRLLDGCNDFESMGAEILAAVERNATWRGEQCINLLAPEAPTSPTVRRLLSAEVGTRAAEGHIGQLQRWFTGTKHIDEIEALTDKLDARDPNVVAVRARAMIARGRYAQAESALRAVVGRAPASEAALELGLGIGDVGGEVGRLAG